MAALRKAVKSDSRAIRRLIWKVGINPIGLDWRRFIVALDDTGCLIGCGQIKPHADGSRELASIAVEPKYQGRGLGSAIIRHLLAETEPPIYLTCRASLESYYQQFGFSTLSNSREMPAYFRRVSRAFEILIHLLPRRTEKLLVMVKPG